MAATPPLQITGSPRTPYTPLHGAVYDHEDSPRRSSARLRQKRAHEETTDPSASRASRAVRTPDSTRASKFEPFSPDRTPQHKVTGRRVQVMSPTSPDSDTFAPKPTKPRSSNLQPFLSTNTTLSEGMLPTPVKTPNKKQKTVNQSNIAARALFQDQLTSEEMAPSPRRNRKNRRYNGFSLESFRAEDGTNQGGIQIFTDSRDQVPEVDANQNNPFIDQDVATTSSKRVAGTSKRRKVSQPKKLDPQVEEALRDDEGMVYVFRGKKVYRRFDDTGEEEEEIDADDLGLLEHTTDGMKIVKPLRTLTRKSIRPTRLFQTTEQKRAREIEKEEEAATDIEETIQDSNKAEASGQVEPVRAEDAIRASRSKGKASKIESSVPEKADGQPGGKKSSPFDSWKRVKRGSAPTSSVSKTRGRKRAASESLDEAATKQS